jgi:hypothetical protein
MVESDGVVHNAGENQNPRILGKSILLVLFLLPFVHVGIIIGVVIHEVLGHGLSAEALGGVFSSFSVNWDGMGCAFAFLTAKASALDHILFMASGIVVTLIAGWLFLGIACGIKKQISVRLVLLILSYCCLMDGIPYMLWNSLNPVPPGDVAEILDWWEQASLSYRETMLMGIWFVSGIMYVGFTYLFFLLLFHGIESLLCFGKTMSSKARFWAVFFFVVVAGIAGNFSFDWNQIAPGIGLIPTIAGITSVVLSAILIYSFPLKPISGVSGAAIRWRHVILAWCLEGAVILLMIFWLRKGVVVNDLSVYELNQLFQ